MSVYSFSFSPTGTSAKILQGINGAIAAELDADINFSDLTFGPVDTPPLTSDDIVIVSAPVYGGKIAPLLKQRLEGISGNNAGCIVVAVYGNRAFENAVADLASFMSARGFNVVGAAAFVGEHSYSTSATPIAPGRPDRQDLADAGRFGKEIAVKMKRGELRPVVAGTLADEPSPAESMVNFRNFVAGYVKMQSETPVKYLPQLDKSLCDECGACYDACPTRAIIAGRDGVDESKCIKCCACVKICPRDARHLDSPFARPLSENFSLRKSPRWIL